jgi:transcriptional regulator with XRE-family HTH domain
MTVSSGEIWPGRQLVVTQRVRDRRSELGLTQKQVVTRLARYGVRTTNRALSSLEHGAGVDVVKLPELAAALDCTVSYLLGLTLDPQKWEPDGAPETFAAQSHRVRASELDRTAHPAEHPDSLILGSHVPDRTLGPVSTGRRQ